MASAIKVPPLEEFTDRVVALSDGIAALLKKEDDSSIKNAALSYAICQSAKEDPEAIPLLAISISSLAMMVLELGSKK